MKLYSLSNDCNKPCHILKFCNITLMLDCGLSQQSVLNFMPLSFVQNNRLLNLPSWMPPDVQDVELEGELKENYDRIFVDGPLEFCPPIEKLMDLSSVDVILISNYLCMLALPYITERTGFQGLVYCTEPTLNMGRLLIKELVTFINQGQPGQSAGVWKNYLHTLPYPLSEAFKPKSWKQIYDMKSVNRSLSRMKVVGYNEVINIYGSLTITPTSSGFCLGSCNWIINSDFEKIVYLSASSTLTTHPRPMDMHSLKNADVLIMTNLTQTPVSNPDSMLGVLCVVVGLTLRGGGNVLIPCYPTGVVYDLFECLSLRMNDLGVANAPMFFISPVADSSLAYSNILAEWLAQSKQSKIYLAEEPFPHGHLVKTSKLKHFPYIYSNGFSTDFQEPCVVFCGHPSLRFGDAVQFMELWGSNPRNCVIFTEPDFDYVDALAPYQPLAMKVTHCAIDTSLNFVQANKLIKDLKPSTLVVPASYTVPPSSAPPVLNELVIETPPDRNTVSYTWGEVLNLPVKRNQRRIFLEQKLAMNVKPVEVAKGVTMCSIDTEMEVLDNRHYLRMTEERADSYRRLDFGSVDVCDFVERLRKAGINDVKVDRSGPDAMIFLNDGSASIKLKENDTHILCNDNEALRQQLRTILMSCLKRI